MEGNVACAIRRDSKNPGAATSRKESKIICMFIYFAKRRLSGRYVDNYDMEQKLSFMFLLTAFSNQFSAVMSYDNFFVVRFSTIYSFCLMFKVYV